MVSKLLVPNGIGKAVCPCTHYVPISITARPKPKPHTALLELKFGCIKASSFQVARFHPKLPHLAMKKDVHVALVAIVLMAAAVVVTVAQRLVLLVASPKENNHAATFTQKVSQRAKGS